MRSANLLVPLSWGSRSASAARAPGVPCRLSPGTTSGCLSLQGGRAAPGLQRSSRPSGYGQRHPSSVSSSTRCRIAHGCSSGCRRSRAIAHAVRASIPGPKSAARRRACQVVRGASTQRTSGKRTPPVPGAVPARQDCSTGAGPGLSGSGDAVLATSEVLLRAAPEGSDQPGDHQNELPGVARR